MVAKCVQIFSVLFSVFLISCGSNTSSQATSSIHSLESVDTLEAIDSLDRQLSCKVGPVSIQSGRSLPAADGCNQCNCLDGGLACTEMGCMGATAPQGCKVGVALFKVGETLKAVDGFNTCTCSKGGKMICTQKTRR